jgi:hypothetical protein
MQQLHCSPLTPQIYTIMQPHSLPALMRHNLLITLDIVGAAWQAFLCGRV